MKTHPLFEGNSFLKCCAGLTPVNRKASMQFVTFIPISKRFSMKLSKLKSALVVLALVGTGMAQAAIVTFENPIVADADAQFAPLYANGDAFLQGGFAFFTYSTKAGAGPADFVGAMINGADVANTCVNIVCPTNNSTSFLALLNDGYLEMYQEEGLAFKASKFDASFIAPTGEAVGSVSMILRAVGYVGATAVYTQDFNLPGPTNGAYSFSSYSLSAANANRYVTELDLFGFYCSGSTCSRAFDKAQFALDNIDVTPVPEPSTWMLMVVGLAAAAAVARRRRA